MDEIDLKFEDWKKEISRDKSKDPWITVFEEQWGDNKTYSTFCCLAPNKEEYIKKVLGHFLGMFIKIALDIHVFGGKVLMGKFIMHDLDI